MKTVKDEKNYIIVYYCFMIENDYKLAEEEFDNIFYNSQFEVGLLPACKICNQYECKYNAKGVNYGAKLE